MIETQGKLLFLAFFTILIGVVLIQPIGDDIELAKVSSINVSNESVSLTVVTVDIANETVTMTSDNLSANVTNNYLTSLSGLRNVSSEDIITFCNVTLASGALACNFTGSGTIFADYTYNQRSTGELANDELNNFDLCRNSSMIEILEGTHCNVTLSSGAVTVKYDNFTDDLAFINYRYQPDTFVSSTAARSLLTQTRLFFAIAILIVGITFAIAAFKKSGVM